MMTRTVATIGGLAFLLNILPTAYAAPGGLPVPIPAAVPSDQCQIANYVGLDGQVYEICQNLSTEASKTYVLGGACTQTSFKGACYIFTGASPCVNNGANDYITAALPAELIDNTLSDYGASNCWIKIYHNNATEWLLMHTCEDSCDDLGTNVRDHAEGVSFS